MSKDQAWYTKPLGHVIRDIGDGGTPNTNKNEYFGGSIPWVVIQDIRKEISTTKTTLTQLGLDSCSAKLWPPGAVILSTGATIGEVGMAVIPVATKQGIHGIVCANDLLSIFLYYKLQTLRDFLNANAQGSTIREVRAPFIRTIPICFPSSLSEQKKIGEILLTIDSTIEQTEALIAKHQRIKTGMMQDLLSRGIDEHGALRYERTHSFKDSPLGRIPADWDVMSLGDVAEIIDPNPSHRYPPPCDTGVPIASTENFQADNEFDLTRCENVPRSVFEEQLGRCRYQPADVVFARKGRIGLARPYGSTEKVFSHTVVIIKAKVTDQVVTQFLLWVVRNREFFRQIEKRMNSNSGVPTLGVQFLAAIPILVPKTREQQRIVHMMSQVEAALEREQNSLRKLRSLKTGLMQDLLTGRRRVTALLEQEPKREKIYARH
ncbi:MAG TPA: restriction endonuclease subunit S [Candidatus Acidoferrum sp.]|nr:restriction endonuclease subunit S [Candidatus Acidoferrum sp.]